jgi:stearoyl-CoA desaturase (delta-9 desaturase)
MDYLYGLLNLSFTGYVIVTLVMVQITMMGVTLYLHRDQAHRSVDLHPVLRHFFRLWIWMTSGMLTKEWVAVHRKHHALCEVEGDPHSPKVFGLPKVLFEGAELYQIEQKKPETLEKYGRGTPDDWLERNVYHRFVSGGIIAMVLIDLLLFGVPGIIIIAVQMITMPLFAAGVINGLGHHSGYRNFETDDASTNLIPWGVLVGGEELHNNHHAFPSSSKFSIRPWEFDIGWLYLKIFSAFGLAKIRRPRRRTQPYACASGIHEISFITGSEKRHARSRPGSPQGDAKGTRAYQASVGVAR